MKNETKMSENMKNYFIAKQMIDYEQWCILNFLRYMIQEGCSKEDTLNVLEYLEYINKLSMCNTDDPNEVDKAIESFKNEFQVVEAIGKYLTKESYSSSYEDLEDESDDRNRDICALVALFNGWDKPWVHVHDQA